MAHRSTVIIIVLTFALLFSLMYASSLIANLNSDNLYAILETKKAEASLHKLIEPETVCFTLNDDTVRRYASIAALIKEADSLASDTLPLSNADSNRYDGFATGVNATEIVPLVRQLQDNFNHTVATVHIRNYTDERHVYNCNFAYNGNQYYLDVRFQSLGFLNEYDGFVAIDITSNKNRIFNNHLTYNTFNNTAVWTNHLKSFVTLTLAAELEGQEFTVTTKIPPGKSWDYRLHSDYSRIEDTNYQYRIGGSSGSDWASGGEIRVKHYPQCMSQELAQSLYSQSSIQMKHPTFLPEGYQYICGIHFSNRDLIQTYWNRTVEDPLEARYGEEQDYGFTNFAFNNAGLNAGIIQVIAGKVGVLTGHLDAQDRFDEIRYQTYYLDQQLIEIENAHDGKRYTVVAYRHNVFVEKDIYILELYDKENKEYYIFRAKQPLSDLTKMAASLS